MNKAPVVDYLTHILLNLILIPDRVVDESESLIDLEI